MHLFNKHNAQIQASLVKSISGFVGECKSYLFISLHLFTRLNIEIEPVLNKEYVLHGLLRGWFLNQLRKTFLNKHNENTFSDKYSERAFGYKKTSHAKIKTLK